MSRTVRLLILEDEDLVRNAIIRAFQLINKSQHDYRFAVKSADSPRSCVDQGLDREEFDVYLVDLAMTRWERPFFGHLFVQIRAFEVPGSVLIVYSQYPQVENVIRAIRHGATDFVVKADCPPDALPERVIRLLDELHTREENDLKLDRLVEKNAEEWHSQYAGKVLLLVNDKVVEAYETRIAAVVHYEELRQDHEDWPEEPQLIEIPADHEVPV